MLRGVRLAGAATWQLGRIESVAIYGRHPNQGQSDSCLTFQANARNRPDKLFYTGQSGLFSIAYAEHKRRSQIGRYRITTNRNNFNRPRIFSFRAKLQTPKFVSMPSCATMKSNRRVFPGRKSETAQLSGFKTCNSFPFNKAPKKTAHFSAVFRPGSQPDPLQRGCNRMGALKFCVMERLPNLGY